MKNWSEGFMTMFFFTSCGGGGGGYIICQGLSLNLTY